MYILNRWYVAGFESELTQAPIARTFFDEPVVIFRTESGTPVLLEDRCCHRNLPLSHGRVQGDHIACAYHGLVYDARGYCVHVPGQDTVPSEARVRSYPVRCKDGLIWFWPGVASLADSQTIVDYPYHRDPRWAHKASHYIINCNHELINDNLIDLSHVGYVHAKTIGGTPGAHSEAKIETERRDEGVIVRRWLPNSLPPPTYQRHLGFTGRIDRWMEIDFVPGLIRIYIGANDAGVGLDEANRMDKLGIRIFNGITPEAANRTHYLWTAAHNFKVDDPAVTNGFHAEIAATFEEDRVVVEAQEQRFAQFPHRKTIMIRSDAGGVHARRVMARMLEGDAGSS